MPHLPTLTESEQQTILAATAGNIRDYLVYCITLGIDLCLAEIVGLNVGDVFGPEGMPRSRVRIRAEIARDGRPADVFIPDRFAAEISEVLEVPSGVAGRGLRVPVTGPVEPDSPPTVQEGGSTRADTLVA